MILNWSCVSLIQRLMSFKPGDWINHPKFGAGLIETHDDPYFVVHFVKEGEKRVQASFITEAGHPPSPGFRFPTVSRAAVRGGNGQSKSKRAAHSFEHFVERFIGA